MSGTINITSLYGYLDLLQDYSVDALALLDECGIDYQQLLSQQGSIQSAQLYKLLHTTAEKTGDPFIGLKLSEKQSHNILGLVGILMEKSPNVRAAILNGIQYFKLHGQGIHLELEEHGDRALYKFQIIDRFEQVQTTVDMAIRNSCNIVRILTGRYDAIDAVYLKRSNPEASNQFRKLMGVPVTFNHELNALIYNRKLLDIPLPGYSDLLYAELLGRVERLYKEIPQTITEQVKASVHDSLPSGQCSIDTTAKKLGLSRQQLQLRLKNEGNNYKDITEQVRKTIAKERLLNSDISITNLSVLLGYSDQTAFGRAFQRWYGMRPRSWRLKFR
tara:strand:- start:3512 stop:4507 length:996 start_codon:yes stop_codon:yes gene_type:complete